MSGDMCIVNKDEWERLNHYYRCIPILIQGYLHKEQQHSALSRWDSARMQYHWNKEKGKQ